MLGKQTIPGHISQRLTIEDHVYKITIPAGTLEFWFQLKDLPAYKLQYSYSKDIDLADAEKVFMTIPAGGSVSKTDLGLENDTILHVKCPDAAGQYVIVEYWK